MSTAFTKCGKCAMYFIEILKRLMSKYFDIQGENLSWKIYHRDGVNLNNQMISPKALGHCP